MFSARFTVMMISFFCLFIVFLYGPMFCILVLSFQGPEGGLTFPMRGLSMFWFESLFDGVGVIDIWSAFGRSLRLGARRREYDERRPRLERGLRRRRGALLARYCLVCSAGRALPGRAARDHCDGP